MARKLKFALEMKDGAEVRSNIEELRKNFDREKIVEHFLSGKLLEWLEDRYYDDEAEKISSLDKNSPNLLEKICDAIGIKYLDPEIEKAINARLNEKKNFLRQKTNDSAIIDNVAITALNQEDLADLIDADEPTIYLCGESFNIPIRIENKKYVGVLSTPKIKIKADSWREIKEKNIVFVNVDLTDNLQEPKHCNATNMPPPQNNSSSTPVIKSNSTATPVQKPAPPKIIVPSTPAVKPAPPPPPKPKSLPIHELKRILLESYDPPSLGASFALAMFGDDKDKDYGDLWHIRNSGFFVDERFHKISGSDKKIALRLICQGRYNENDLVRIGVIFLDTDSRQYRLYAKTTDDRFWGFALTKDSFCLKGLYTFSKENFIIPYGNIKETYITSLKNLKIIFHKNKTETTDIIWDVKYADSYTFEQLTRYLNKVKNYYQPDYDKIIY